MRLTPFQLAAALCAALLVSAKPTLAQNEAPRRLLIANVNIFDGDNKSLSCGAVLVESNVITEVGSNITAPDATVIDGHGRTLMPGLIDMHAHHAGRHG